MKNHLFRRQLVTNIQNAINEANNASAQKHLGIKGRFREVALQKILAPLLPNGVDIATGTVIDSQGNQSDQIDIIIYSTSILPEFMKQEEQVVVPAEACLQVLEVKSRLDATEMKDAIKKAHSIKKLQILRGRDSRNQFVVPPIFTLFAFDTDLSGRGKSEWDRYNEYKTDELKNSILLNDICVVGSGYWALGNMAQLIFEEPSKEYNEVISMLIFCTNSIQEWIRYRGYPLFGDYLK